MITKIDAFQWFKNGDHPKDDREAFVGSDGKPFLGEGKVVRYYRRPDVLGTTLCSKCNNVMHEHGWIDSGGDGRDVCPGDWIVTQADGYYPYKTKAFSDLLAKLLMGGK